MILAQLIGGSATLTALAVTTVVLLVVSLVGRWRLPIGISTGLFIVGLSTALVVHYGGVGVASEEPLYRLAVTFAGLALFWLIVVAWVERPPTADDHSEHARRRQFRRMLGLHAAAIAGMLAVSAMLAMPPTALALLGASPATIICLLLAVTAGCYIHAPGPLPRYAATALVGLLVWLALPRAATEMQRGHLAWILLLAGASLLATVVVTVVRDWRRRIVLWRADPETLLQPPPPHRLVYGAVIVLAMGVAMLGVVIPRAMITPFGLFFAALAVLGIGHRRMSDGAGEVGMGLILLTVATLPQAWLPGGVLNPILGLGLAGAYLAWQARFWDQQLDRGRPWTTAGRLIPYVRQMSIAAGAAAFTLAATTLWRLPGLDDQPVWITILTLLVLLLHGSMLMRDARRHDHAGAAMAAVLAWLAALVPAAELLGDSASPSLLVALLGLLLALRIASQPADTEVGWVYNAYIAGVIPAATAYAAILSGDAATRPAATAIAALCVMAAIGLRWGVFLRAVPKPQKRELTT